MSIVLVQCTVPPIPLPLLISLDTELKSRKNTRFWIELELKYIDARDKNVGWQKMNAIRKETDKIKSDYTIEWMHKKFLMEFIVQAWILNILLPVHDSYAYFFHSDAMIVSNGALFIGLRSSFHTLHINRWEIATIDALPGNSSEL